MAGSYSSGRTLYGTGEEERLSSPALRDDGALEWEDLTLLELAISLCTPCLGFQPHEIGEEEGDTETERVLCLDLKGAALGPSLPLFSLSLFPPLAATAASKEHQAGLSPLDL